MANGNANSQWLVLVRFDLDDDEDGEVDDDNWYVLNSNMDVDSGDRRFAFLVNNPADLTAIDGTTMKEIADADAAVAAYGGALTFRVDYRQEGIDEDDDGDTWNDGDTATVEAKSSS